MTGCAENAPPPSFSEGSAVASSSSAYARTLPEPGLHIEVTREQHVTTVYVNGDVDLATAELLSAATDLALQGPPLRVIVDLAEVSFFGAAGLTVLVDLQERTERAAIDLILRAPSLPVRTVLDIVDAAQRFRIVRAGFQGGDRGQSRASNAAV
jgi:anti-anti-sigma factor